MKKIAQPELSVIIPCRNEEGCVAKTIDSIHSVLDQEKITHQIIAVNDGSIDRTKKILGSFTKHHWFTYTENIFQQPGYGYAVRSGIAKTTGKYTAIMMADASDSPLDLVSFYKTAGDGYDCMFGNRFMSGGKIHGYPVFKLILNRLFNTFVQIFFRINYNDCTNAFKLYRTDVLKQLRPYLAPHFNFTLELPLKAIVRGYSYTVLPNSWENRKQGSSKLKIKEMGGRYFYILLYCWIEKHFAANDFHKRIHA